MTGLRVSLGFEPVLQLNLVPPLVIFLDATPPAAMIHQRDLHTGKRLLFIVLVLNRGSLLTCCVDQAGFKLSRDLPVSVSASRILELKVCTTNLVGKLCITNLVGKLLLYKLVTFQEEQGNEFSGALCPLMLRHPNFTLEIKFCAFWINSVCCSLIMG